ncbi:MAG TPA: signal peptide peptidase SppA [Flavisolibacter sp.]|jgi:protease-4|nr:signal peptide peptidase SppA [Flavisolibacter sp.]
MRSFFKIFFASFLSLVIFSLICLFLFIAFVTALASKDKPEIPAKSVLVINLSQNFHERKQDNPLSAVSGESDVPGLYDVIRLIDYAKTDNNISGIYIEADANASGFASSNEIRNALIDFKTSKKFIIAHGDMMTQGAYFIANVADKIYVNPAGDLEWKGFAVSLVFIKDLLDKLNIQPQIFYAGKYKSATEIFRTNQMTPENKLQTTEWLGDMYNYFLVQTSKARGVDTATLHQLANNASIQTPQDAVNNKLIDAAKYDDQIKAELKQRLGIGKTDRLNLIDIAKYNEAINTRKYAKDRIAVIYAEGDIVDGQGTNDNIGGERFRALIRKARLDNSVKAIVMRVNSGGGSALASEIIWRELQMAREDKKPVIVSFGDVAASGGYYISCGADSIFSSPNTITGSIGVFGVIPNMGSFFKNKLGITFDGVKTAPYADGPNIYRPMNDAEKKLAQSGVDRIYLQFKQRVAEGRKKDINYIDSIAQGRVWSGEDALQLGLVDRAGSLQDAINCAARMAKVDKYGLKEYPESGNWLQNLLHRQKNEPSAMIREQLGEEQFKVYNELLRVKEMTKSTQTRLPYQFFVH